MRWTTESLDSQTQRRSSTGENVRQTGQNLTEEETDRGKKERKKEGRKVGRKTGKEERKEVRRKEERED